MHRGHKKEAHRYRGFTQNEEYLMCRAGVDARLPQKGWRTTHKINWTKEHPRGGGLLEGKPGKNAVAWFVHYEDCICVLFPREERTSIPAIRQWWHAAGHRVPPPVPRGTLAPPIW